MSDGLLDGLREHFRESWRVRLQEMDALLDALERDAGDAESLRKLATDFHGLAGLGGTYGFPRVSELGEVGEGELLLLVRGGGAADGAGVARWRSLVAEIRRELG